MTKEEVVRLVSRALAVIPFIWALEDITYRPERMFAIHHYHRGSQGLGLSYIEVLYRFEISSLFFRIILLITLAWILCAAGPRITRYLLGAAGTLQYSETKQHLESNARGTTE